MPRLSVVGKLCDGLPCINSQCHIYWSHLGSLNLTLGIANVTFQTFFFPQEASLVIIAGTVERGICFHCVVRLIQNDSAAAAGPLWPCKEMEVRMMLVNTDTDI